DMYGARVAVFRSSTLRPFDKLTVVPGGVEGRPAQGRSEPGRETTGAQSAPSHVEGRANGLTLWRRARADGSYASANDPRVLVGLGASTEAPHVRVIWPNGHAEEWAGIPIDGYTTLREGTGK